MLGTNRQTSLYPVYFGNSLYLGLNTINTNSYYMMIILPEALFNGTPLNSINNVISIYSTNDSLFYFNFNSSSSSRFVPLNNYVSSSTNQNTPASNSSTTNNTYYVNKIILPVSNVELL